MKRICLIILCVLLALTLVGCSKNESSSKNKKPQINDNDNGGEEVDNTIVGLKEGWNDSNLNDKAEKFFLPYRIYLPKGYTTDKKYPVLFFLHGNGSRGSDNTTQMNNAQICDTLLADPNTSDIIIIAPQCSAESMWVLHDAKTEGNYIMDKELSPYLSEALNVFDYWCSKLSTDENRYYLYGNSNGGHACYDLMSRFPDKWAAAVVVAGCGDLNQADKLKDIPIWIHHGTTDNLVPYETSTKMVDALKKAGAGDNIILTTYEGEGHTIFGAVGLNKDVANWIYDQKK